MKQTTLLGEVELVIGGILVVCKVMLGAKLKDYAIYDFKILLMVVSGCGNLCKSDWNLQEIQREVHKGV